jgi:signal transduction histidine kinase
MAMRRTESARSDRGLTTHEVVDLEAAVQDAIDDVSAPARRAHVDIYADLSPAQTRGDRVLLERLAANLLDNAVRYNVDGGFVKVMVGTSDGASCVTVINSGELIPDSQVDLLFEPFTRHEERIDRSGVGLGLSIVRSVVSAHHGQLLPNALPDGGMRIAVRFQAAETS